MSGIAGVFERNGNSIDAARLQTLMSGIAYRGSDEQAMWNGGCIGLASALLRTTWESATERAITSKEHVCLVADARIDRRTELIREIALPHEPAPTDSDLILEAYLRWGERCVEHLRGDFAFALWDSKNRRLLCARDHFGVKPLFYAELGSAFLFSSDVTCLREAGVSSNLNEQALIDFIVFGHNRDWETTTFRAIRKLPAAHTMTVDASGKRIQRYWALPREGRIRFQRNQDYVDRYRELLTRAVSDRLRVDKAAILMSGGLDSTSIAATAVHSDLDGRKRTELQAYTVIEELLVADPEKEYSAIAARALGIPQQIIPLDSYEHFDGGEQLELDRPEPQEAPFRQSQSDLFGRLQKFSRVLLDGTGGDLGLMASHADKPMTKELAVQALRSFAPLLVEHRRIPRLGFRTALRKLAPSTAERVAAAPEWLTDRARSDPRWAERWRSFHVLDLEVTRPAAYTTLADVRWSAMFERLNPIPARFHMESRFPFFDVDLVTYVLALPSLPWFVEKHLLRRATKIWLPEEVRLRPKTWVVGDPVEARKAQIDQYIAQFQPSSRLLELVNWNDMRSALTADGMSYSEIVRVIALDLWLRAWHLTSA